VERASVVAGCNLLFRLLGLRHGILRCHCGKGVELGIQGLDALECSLDQINWGDLSVPNQWTQLRDGCGLQVKAVHLALLQCVLKFEVFILRQAQDDVYAIVPHRRR